MPNSKSSEVSSPQPRPAKVSKRDWLWVTLIGTLSVALFCLNINGWQFGIVGDGYAYFDFAADIARRDFHSNLFSLRGVYGLERALGSFWHALFIRFYGENIVAWRLANGVCLLPQTLLVFWSARALWGRAEGFGAAILLASSSVLLNFYKVGYTHPLCLTAYLACLALTVRVMQRGHWRDYAALGIALGVSFYLYVGPVFPVIFGAALLGAVPRVVPDESRPNPRKALQGIALTFLLTAGLASLGFLLSPRDEWFTGAAKTAFNSNEISGLAPVLLNMARNFAAWFADWDYAHRHYIWGGAFDIFTRWLAVIGLARALWNWKMRSARFLIGLWIATCLVMGAINPYFYTPSTRVFMLVPCGILFAASGGQWLVSGLARKFHPQAGTAFKHTQIALATPILLGIAAWNLHWGYRGVFRVIGFDERTLALAYARQSPQGATLFLSPELNFDESGVQTWGRLTQSPTRLRIVRDRDHLLDAVRQNRSGAVLFLARDKKALPLAIRPEVRLVAPRVAVIHEWQNAREWAPDAPEPQFWGD